MPLLTLNSTLRNTTSPSSLWNNTRRQEEKNLKGLENVLLLFFLILRLHENCISKPVKSFSIREPHHKAIRKIGRDLKCLFHDMCFTKTSKLPDPCELSPTVTAHTVLVSHNKALERFLPWLYNCVYKQSPGPHLLSWMITSLG